MDVRYNTCDQMQDDGGMIAKSRAHKSTFVEAINSADDVLMWFVS